MPLATAAAPPVEPPAVFVRSHGLLVRPKSGLLLCQSARNVGTLVLPRIMAPASLSRAIATPSSDATTSLKPGKPQVVLSPATLFASLTVIGIPSSGLATSLARV